MRRRSFVLSLPMVALAAQAASAKVDSVGISDLVAGIPGTVAVYARLMNATPPAIALRTDVQMPSASIIKLAIMLAVYHGYERTEFAPQTPVTVHASDLIGGSDALAGTPPGTKLEMQSLVNAMIRVSDNSASNALISALGFARINAAIRRAGLEQTRLARHFADVVPSWRRSLNVTSAGDMGRLLYAIERGAREGLDTVASSASCRNMIDVMLGQEDTSKIVRGLPAHTPIAHKTGEIDGVRHDVGIVAPYGDVPFILAVLTSNDESTAAADAGIGDIAARVFKTFHERAPIAAAPAAVPRLSCVRFGTRCE